MCGHDETATERAACSVGPQPERLVTHTCGDRELVSSSIAFERPHTRRDLNAFPWRSALRRQPDLNGRPRFERQSGDSRLPEPIECFVSRPAKTPRVQRAREEKAAVA